MKACNGSGMISRSVATALRAKQQALRGSFLSLFFDWCMVSSSVHRIGEISIYTITTKIWLMVAIGPRRMNHTASSTACLASQTFRPSRITSACRTSTRSICSQISSEKPIAQEPPLSSRLRQLMRIMPHSVVVATATAPAPDRGTPPSYKGMTVSSFTTLTLTPQPIITFNIRKPSSTLDAIQGSGQFLIHILAATQSGASVADAFTKGNVANVFRSPAFTVLKTRGGSASGVDPPLLAAEGITQVLRCDVLNGNQQGLVDVGDHTLVLAKVVSIIEPGHVAAEGQERKGLCYFNRQYRDIGDAIDVGPED